MNLPAVKSHPPELETLLRSHSQLWRGADHYQSDTPSLSTGFAQLDQFLPTGGWPGGAITEIIVDQWGSGELQLLLPLIVQVSQSCSPITFITPPHLPYAPALADAGVCLDYVTMIDGDLSDGDMWWAAEKIFAHSSNGMTLAWPNRHHDGHLRKLQLAASQTQSPGFIFYRRSSAQSPLPLRLQLSRSHDGIRVRIVKSRFGWAKTDTITIAL